MSVDGLTLCPSALWAATTSLTPTLETPQILQALIIEKAEIAAMVYPVLCFLMARRPLATAMACPIAPGGRESFSHILSISFAQG